MKIDNYFHKSAVNNSSKINAIKKEVTEKMVTFCANDMRPFSIVEGAGFLDFC
jgi:hypothetical protein